MQDSFSENIKEEVALILKNIIIVLAILLAGVFFYWIAWNKDFLDLIYQPKIIHVKIDGNITNPGIYKMRNGDRLEDLIQRAGGLREPEKLPNYDPHSLLRDGDSIWLGENL